MLTAGVCDRPVLLTAPTGVAAKNIGGTKVLKKFAIWKEFELLIFQHSYYAA